MRPFQNEKDLNGIPNTMQDPRCTMHDAGESIYPFALSLSKCEHLEYSLNVVAIFLRPAQDTDWWLPVLNERLYHRVGHESCS